VISSPVGDRWSRYSHRRGWISPGGDTGVLIFQGFDRPADSAGVKLIFDLGAVNEDALAVAPDTLTSTGSDSLFTGRQYTGAGRLDTERSPTGIFNASTDDIGILIDRVDTLVVESSDRSADLRAILSSSSRFTLG
jgi:hypothetical protein